MHPCRVTVVARVVTPDLEATEVVIQAQEAMVENLVVTPGMEVTLALEATQAPGVMEVTLDQKAQVEVS